MGNELRVRLKTLDLGRAEKLAQVKARVRVQKVDPKKTKHAFV
jgi:hypothetical protein